MTRWTVFSSRCPSRESLARIANKWTAMIVIVLRERPHRFSELHRRIDGISKKVLVDTLLALERDGMVERSAGSDLIVYRLTPLGETLEQPLLALQARAEAHVDEVVAARDRYDDAQDARLLDGVESPWPYPGNP